MTIRTFIAFDVESGPRLQRVIDQLGQIGSPVRISDSATLHLTLIFLGDTSESAVAELIGILDEVAAEFTGMDAALTGLGVFPHRRKPTVVWTGIRNPSPVVALQQQLERRLQAAGWKPDPREYRPHVTVARVNSRRRPVPGVLFELLDQHTTTDFGTSRLDNIVLYQSESTPRGAHYTALHRSQLHQTRSAKQSHRQNDTGGSV